MATALSATRPGSGSDSDPAPVRAEPFAAARRLSHQLYRARTVMYQLDARLAHRHGVVPRPRRRNRVRQCAARSLIRVRPDQTQHPGDLELLRFLCRRIVIGQVFRHDADRHSGGCASVSRPSDHDHAAGQASIKVNRLSSRARWESPCTICTDIGALHQQERRNSATRNRNVICRMCRNFLLKHLLSTETLSTETTTMSWLKCPALRQPVQERHIITSGPYRQSPAPAYCTISTRGTRCCTMLKTSNTKRIAR